MSCIHETKDHFCYLKSKECEYPCNDFKTEIEPIKYCKYCFNARIYRPTYEELMDPHSTTLDDDNDYSSCSIGTSSKDIQLMITSGNGEPVRIEIDKFLDNIQEWHVFGKYYPKYCPECGRKLDEYGMS